MIDSSSLDFSQALYNFVVSLNDIFHILNLDN